MFAEFEGIDKNELKKDAIEFYGNFVSDGFLNQAISLDKFVESGFSYSTLEGKLAYSNLKPQLEEASSGFLREYFKSTPCLHTFHIELTSKCNERCIHCYIPHESKTTDIDCDLMAETLKQCKSMNVMTLIFSGGEPMLHPHFCGFLRF